MQLKPDHLGPAYASTFADASVAAAYSVRAPYPDEVFDVLAALLGAGSGRVLELGCGSGDLTVGLARHARAVDALDVSAPMLAIARGRDAPNVRWLLQAAETFEPSGRYALAVAGESLYWMEWSVVLPMLGRALEPHAVLAIALARRLVGLPWVDAERALIAEHSTNRDCRPYDLIAELSSRGLFAEHARRECVQPGFAQSVDDYVESFHSRMWGRPGEGCLLERSADLNDRSGAGSMLERSAEPERPQRERDAPAAAAQSSSSPETAARRGTTVVWGRPA